jgi:hypothetical protein
MQRMLMTTSDYQFRFPCAYSKDRSITTDSKQNVLTATCWWPIYFYFLFNLFHLYSLFFSISFFNTCVCWCRSGKKDWCLTKREVVLCSRACCLSNSILITVLCGFFCLRAQCCQCLLIVHCWLCPWFSLTLIYRRIWLLNGFLTYIIRRVSQEEQKQLILPEQLSTSGGFRKVRGFAKSLVVCLFSCGRITLY